MARGINKAILVGNLGNDPETKYTQGGMAITKIRLTTTSMCTDRVGSRRPRLFLRRYGVPGTARAEGDARPLSATRIPVDGRLVGGRERCARAVLDFRSKD